MKRLAVVCVLSILVVACSAESPVAPAPVLPETTSDVSVSFKLSGTVSDSSGAPIQGARVEASDLERVVASSETDSNGNYVLAALPVGAYNVVVTKDGYLPWTDIFNFFRDRTWNVMLRR